MTEPAFKFEIPHTAVIETKDANGYTYVSTSPEWNSACSILPCMEGLQWPGYATRVLHTTLSSGEPIIIQLWKGCCQQFFGRTDYPGGIGGEVGVYRLTKRTGPTPTQAALPAWMRPGFEFLNWFAWHKFWWPDPKLTPKIDFELINPLTRKGLLAYATEGTYWCNKWMAFDSYKRYQAANPNATPHSPTDYLMVFTVDGVTHTW